RDPLQASQPAFLKGPLSALLCSTGHSLPLCSSSGLQVRKLRLRGADHDWEILLQDRGQHKNYEGMMDEQSMLYIHGIVA
ncbi:hypothetical protein LEMLEM_LOCUS24527, partial [Lemmus lemmus]